MINEITFNTPYSLSGMCNYKRREYFNKKGVYLIRHTDTKEMLYVGKGACVYRQMYGHFQQWINRDIIVNGMRYQNVFIDRAFVEVSIILTQGAYELERQLIDTFKPLYNRRFPKEAQDTVILHIKDNPLAHLDWCSVEKEWQKYISEHGREPF